MVEDGLTEAAPMRAIAEHPLDGDPLFSRRIPVTLPVLQPPIV